MTTESAARNLLGLISYIESRFPVGETNPIFITGLSVTGEPYIVLSGFVSSPLGDSDAIAAAKIAFDEYAKDKSGTLYWRIKPETEVRSKVHGFPADGWAFYMRLLISSKPVIEAK